LTKFDGLNVRICVRGDEDVAYRTSDILVCAYGLFSELVGRCDHSSFWKTRVEFASMILDLRHPHATTRDNVFIKKEENMSLISKSLVESVRWWLRLNSFLSKCSTSMKRLVIEQMDLPQNGLYLPVSEGIYSRSDEQTKRFDELLAMKVAFFYHPAVFFSERGSVGKRVISWAKNEAMKTISIKVTAHGITLAHILSSGNSASSSCGYRSELMALLKNSCDSLVDVMRVNNDQSNESLNNYLWQLRTCSLAKPQLNAYNLCHSNVGGSDDEIAGDLLKLRKICFHSNLDKITENVITPLCFRRRNGQSWVERNGSILVSNSRAFLEPRFDVAKKVMKKSSKMKELLSILIDECGFNIAGKFDLKENTFDIGDSNLLTDEGPKKKLKVLILATLVEAQLLTSYFLSAVGLHHEVLLSSNANDHASLHSSARASEIAWSWSQDILSRFNSNIARSDGHRSINILISSPVSISSHNGGIGAASADVVISIDEDWSGREAIHVKSIISKINRHRRRTMRELTSSCSDPPFKFVKIVCQHTFEETFLCNRRSTINDDEKKHEKETQQRCNIGTRKSFRQSQRTMIANQDDAVSGNAKVSQKCPTKMGSPFLFCPMKIIPTVRSINSDGFLIPPTNGGNVTLLKNVDTFLSAQSNILSLSFVELASAFKLQNPGTNSCHFPNKNGLKYSAFASDCTEAFLRALFNTEDRASFISKDSANKLVGVNLKLRSITVSHTATIVAGSSYNIRRYVESFKNSSSFIQYERGEKLIPILNERLCDTGSGNIYRDTSSNQSNTTSEELCETQVTSNLNNDKLLVYSVSNAKIPVDEFTSKRGQSDCLGSFNPSGGDLALRIFSSSLNSSSNIRPQDENYCFEPYSYFPSFFLHLSQGNMIGGYKRKVRPSMFEEAVVETSRCSFRENRNEYGNAELTFHRRVLAADLQGATYCQQRPALNCMILITQKKHQLESNAIMAGGIVGHSLPPLSTHKNSCHPGKKSLHKKIKRHHIPESSATRDESNNLYFSNDHLLAQIFAVRDGIKLNITASALGRARSQSLLNDFISNSLSRSSITSNLLPIETEHQSQQSVPYPIQSIGSVLLGTIPCVDVEIIRKKKSYLSRITLPVEVKSLQESSEYPWSAIEDSVLQQSVLRYGMNWHLAAKAVSSGMTFLPSRFEEGKEYGGRAGRRSAVQCQNRWMTLKTNKIHAPLSPSPSIVKCTTPTIDTDGTVIVPMDRENPLFENTVCQGVSSMNRSKQEPNQSSSLLWLSTSNPAPDVSDLPPISKEKRLALVSRIQILKAASKKRHVVKPSLPTYTQVHASHSDAIQAARASMLSAANGVAPPRHEMWPLELLDFRRQHIAPANQNLTRGATPHPTQHSSAPHHPHHTMHPSQHQMYHAPGQMPTQHQSHHQQGHDRANPNVNYPQQRHLP
jgi:hypothetical protein